MRSQNGLHDVKKVPYAWKEVKGENIQLSEKYITTIVVQMYATTFTPFNGNTNKSQLNLSGGV